MTSPGPHEERPISDTIEAYFQSINSEDWDRLAQLFHPEAELSAPGTRTRHGGEGVASYYRDALGPYPEHHDEATRVIAAGRTVTVEIHFDGRLASGARMSFDAVDVFDFVDGRIHRLSSWYDSHRVRRDLLAALAAETADARVRWSLGLVRRGVAFRLDAPAQRVEGATGAALWAALAEAPDAMLARGVLLDLGARPAGDVTPEELEACAADQVVALRPGDVVMLRTGATGVALAASPALAWWLRSRGLAGVVTDATPLADVAGALGANWWLEELTQDCRQDGVWEGLVVSVPCDDGHRGRTARPLFVR